MKRLGQSGFLPLISVVDKLYAEKYINIQLMDNLNEISKTIALAILSMAVYHIADYFYFADDMVAAENMARNQKSFQLDCAFFSKE